MPDVEPERLDEDAPRAIARLPEPTRIVVLGGGFGGLAAVRELERVLPADANVRITLVNRENFTLFTPMLHEVAASDLDVTTIVNPIRKLVRRGTLFTGTVDAIDLDARTVTLTHGAGAHTPGHAHVLRYDHLVIALGAITNFLGVPGAAERAITMRSLGDALRLRTRLIRHLEEADFECNAEQRDPLLGVVVAGGGFAGVETVAAVHDFLRAALRYYPSVGPEHLRVSVVHPGAYLLPELGERLGRYAGARLAERGVDVLLNARVAAVEPDAVVLKDGRRLTARTVVWTAGNAAHPVLDALPCAKARGRIVTDACLRVPEWPGVWALGDCAHVPDGEAPDGAAHPPTAQHALRMGALAGRNVAAALRGEAPRPFAFRTIGQLAAIGRRTGVASLRGRMFSGFVAWVLWRAIYLAKLPRFEKKLRVALDWMLDLIFSKDLVQFATGPAPAAPGRPPAAPAVSAAGAPARVADPVRSAGSSGTTSR